VRPGKQVEGGTLVRRLLQASHARFGRRAAQIAGAALIGLGLCGCSNFWDTVSSREFKKSPWDSLFGKPEPPLVVLEDSQDGNKRVKAIRMLTEPKAKGGTDQEQDVVVAVLVTTAKSDPRPLCRLAAIDQLATFKDPRATQGLIDAYYKATTFQPDTATVVQCATLTALGNTKNPAAVELLTRVVRAPAIDQTVPEQDKQQEQDRRIAAAHALGNFSHYAATESLINILTKEKDVAIRDRAHESLVASTGKDFGYDSKAWENYLSAAADGRPPAEEKKISLISWWK
jgi:hypothetical protein